MVGEGQVATVYHLIEGMQADSTVRLVRETTTHPIEFALAVDKSHDLAILKTDVSAPILPFGDSDTVKTGEEIYVTGNPDGYAGTFSVGVISAIRHDDPLIAGKTLQITAPISPGSSGGPVLNRKGEVIGIINGDDPGGQNLNFAAPANALKTLLTTIR